MVDKVRGKENHSEVPAFGKNREIEKRQKGSITVHIAKLADEIVVREDADIDEIADKVAKKVVEVAANMG